MNTRTTESGADWSIDALGYVEIYHMNEQHPLVLTADDINEISVALLVWQEDEAEREHQRELEKSQKDYEQYLLIKQRFES